MITGTSHFISKDAAIRYYALAYVPAYIDKRTIRYKAAIAQATTEVDYKLLNGEIHIGPPSAPKYWVNREEGRYFIS